MSVRRKRAVGLAAGGVGLLASLWLLGSAYAVHARTSRAAPPFDEPATEHSDAEVLRLETSDGETVGAWFFAPQGAGPAVLLLHGTGGCRSQMGERIRLAREQGAAVLAMTLRAHGDSTGDHYDVGYGSRHDVMAGVEVLEARCPERPLIVHGFSAGAAAAVFAAKQLGERVDAYILEAPYETLAKAVRARTQIYLPWGVEWLAYAGLAAASSVLFPEAGRIAPVQEIGEIPKGARVLIIAGEQDLRAPPSHARALFDRVVDHARLEVIPEADHGTIDRMTETRHQAVVRTFYEQIGDDR